MKKEEAIQEFESFCKETLAKFPLKESNGTINGVKNRLEEFSDLLKPINKILTEKINELIPQIAEEEQENFITEVKNITQKETVKYFKG